MMALWMMVFKDEEIKTNAVRITLKMTKLVMERKETGEKKENNAKQNLIFSTKGNEIEILLIRL